MFTDQLTKEQKDKAQPGRNIVKSYQGVDITAYQCYKLQPDLMYEGFDSSTIHWAIDAMQKGRKVPTQIGLRRLKRKVMNKKNKVKKSQNSIPQEQNQKQEKIELKAKPLNPLSTEELCLKSMRTQFRQKMEKELKQNEKQAKVLGSQLQRKILRKPKFIRKKENQLKRRTELLYLVNEYKHILQKIFPAQKLQGFNRKTKCPKLSRQEIKDGLAKYFAEEAVRTQEKLQDINNPQKMAELIKIRLAKRQEKRKRQEARFIMRKQSSSSEDDSSSSSSSEVSSVHSDEESSEVRKKVKVE